MDYNTLINFAGVAIGSLVGILASAKLTNYRIEQLEKRVVGSYQL